MGLVNKPLVELMREGTKGSSPLALLTIALSTILIAGATLKADKIAAALSTPALAKVGDGSYEISDMIIDTKLGQERMKAIDPGK